MNQGHFIAGFLVIPFASVAHNYHKQLVHEHKVDNVRIVERVVIKEVPVIKEVVKREESRWVHRPRKNGGKENKRELETVGKVAMTFGVNPKLMQAICKQESYGCNHVIHGKLVKSPVGAVGKMQVMPSTCMRMMKHGGKVAEENCKNGDAAYNVVAAAKYLKFLSDRYNGNPTLIAAAYNAGECAVDGGCVRKGKKLAKHAPRVPHYRETMKYVANVNMFMRSL